MKGIHYLSRKELLHLPKAPFNLLAYQVSVFIANIVVFPILARFLTSQVVQKHTQIDRRNGWPALLVAASAGQSRAIKIAAWAAIYTLATR